MYIRVTRDSAEKSSYLNPHSAMVDRYVQAGKIFWELMTPAADRPDAVGGVREVYVVVTTAKDRETYIRVNDLPPSAAKYVVTCQDSHDFRDLDERDVIIQVY